METQDILALDLDGLNAAIEEHRTKLDEALSAETPSIEDVEKAEAIEQTLSALEAELGRRNEAAEKYASMKERRAQAAAEKEEAEESDAKEEASAEEPEESEEQEEQKTEAASATRSSALSAVGGRTAEPPADPSADEAVVTITAAADVPRLATGTKIPDMKRVSEAMIDRAKGFPQFSGSQAGGQLHRFSVASFAKPFDDDLTIDSRTADAGEILDRAGSEARLGESLTAAGWCAPSQTLLDLCGGASTDGLFDLPETQVRAGLRYTRGPDFSELYSAGFTQTEAEAIAGTTKPCFDIPCPEFEEVRLDAIGLCIKVPLLTNAAWPELVNRYLSEGMVAHQHRVSAYLLDKAVTEAGTAEDLSATFDTGSAAGSILSALEFLIEKKRQSYRLGRNTTMEVVLPMWVNAVVRADLAHRNGVDMLNVTDQMISSWFGTRHARPQFVYNWQDIDQEATAYPATVQALVYPAGTFIRGSAPVISLDAVYDAASLSVNEYTGLFYEEGILLATRCYTPSLVTLSACAAGRTGAADNTNCLTAAVGG